MYYQKYSKKVVNDYGLLSNGFMRGCLKRYIILYSLFSFFIVGGVFGLFPSVAYADILYLNGDSNYPVTYYHVDYREYIDLSSCTFVYNNDDSYEFAVGYMGVDMSDLNNNKYHIRYYRQMKDGNSLPQYLDKNGDKWISIPRFNYDEILDYMRSNGYGGYINTYHAYEYFMFKAAYKQLWNVEYKDELNGQSI